MPTDIAAVAETYATYRAAQARLDPQCHEARYAWVQAARRAFPHMPFCWGAHDDNMTAALRRKGVAV